MKSRRREVGDTIKGARRAAGYKSAKAFAQALGISETSVARAEAGDSRVGQGVYMDIESALHWPRNSISRALETGSYEDLVSQRSQGPSIYHRTVNHDDPWEVQTMELQRFPLEQRWDLIFEHRRELLARQREALQAPAPVEPSPSVEQESDDATNR